MTSSLLRLMTLLSPAFPVGGFAWSCGLESACHTGGVTTAAELKNWILTSLHQGPLHTDAVLLSIAMRQANTREEINALGLALAGSAERFEETTSLGNAFTKAAKPWRTSQPANFPDPVVYPVAIAIVACENNLDRELTLAAFLQSAISNQIQAGLRLFPLGQTAATQLLYDLEPVIKETATALVDATPDDLGTSALTIDIAAMRHETQNSRIFRS